MSAQTTPALYDAACKAVAQAKAIDEVKHIHDQAVAMKVYARQAKNRDLEKDACTIRWRAERRLGQMIKEQKAAGNLSKGRLKRGPAVPEGNSGKLPRLEDAGIDRKLSSRAQKLAEVPEEQFEEALEDMRHSISAAHARVTINLLGTDRERTKTSITTADVLQILRDAGGMVSIEELLRRLVPFVMQLADPLVKGHKVYQETAPGYRVMYRAIPEQPERDAPEPKAELLPHIHPKIRRKHITAALKDKTLSSQEVTDAVNALLAESGKKTDFYTVRNDLRAMERKLEVSQIKNGRIVKWKLRDLPQVDEAA